MIWETTVNSLLMQVPILLFGAVSLVIMHRNQSMTRKTQIDATLAMAALTKALSEFSTELRLRRVTDVDDQPAMRFMERGA